MKVLVWINLIHVTTYFIKDFGECCADNYVIQLSRDHKPEIPAEKERIIRSGGRVDKYTENGVKYGPYRVWLKKENYPGLAMSRSIGDLCATSVGVTPEPGILIYNNLKKYLNMK